MVLRMAIPSENLLGDNYEITNLSVSDYNPNIDSDVTLTVTVKDVYGDAVANKSVTVTASEGNFTKYNGSTITGASSYTGTTNGSGQFTLTYTCSEWGLVTFSANTKNIQVKVKGWRQIEDNSNYTIYTNNEYVQIRVHQDSNSTVPKTYEYSLPVGYYPNYIVGAISGTIGDGGVHYATFSATTSGKFSIKLRQNTYGTDVSTIYGELTYPL